MMTTTATEEHTIEFVSDDNNGKDTGDDNNDKKTATADVEAGVIVSSKTQSQLMESSVLKFKDVNFVVGKNDKKKHILESVSGKVKHGRVLAIMGPSGAGKTTLINALTLDAFYGEPSGSVTLNGVPLSGKLFKKHCFVVKQQDKHWPYLTTRESLMYAAGLYDVGTTETIPDIVDDLINKMGLTVCADTRCARLSGGQKRRLSIAVALLKQPTVLFLDEPTSGLDAAAASNIMQEISRVAKEENLIIVCTIHQPSTKVYNGFDQVMIMSRGRQAFSGDVDKAAPYFDRIGYPMPDATNPAEHFLDLVNSDFSGEEEVEHILSLWDQHKSKNASSHGGSTHGTEHDVDGTDGNDGDDEAVGVEKLKGTGFMAELGIMFKRHSLLIGRDPILYLGRCFIFLVMCTVFAFVYWNARDNELDQLYSKMWIQLWLASVPTNMGVVAVYALNDEFKSIQRESQNGMVSAGTYVLAKSVLVLPIFILFALFALLIPSYVIQAAPWEAFGLHIVLYAALMFVFESVAEALSVLFDDPIIGMLQFMNFWFGSFLFGGFLIPESDLYWPLKLFHYVFPYAYYVRSTMYTLFEETDFDGDLSSTQALDELSKVFPVIESEDNVAKDIGILLAIGAFYKILYIGAVIVKTRKVANINKKLA
eukprot:CAMPEP_0119551744 /NCGR_PEP_ID=MMETSP1352-20130426/4913_1 /TAXON_ID=265584 /ORGANISM="Stauroneis constricta, Strain CCMP1120" /LENGTH=649 /DNA_ID=CAMNT_0007597857 /DNA_START=239 /DNA_END=2188 /DNA_ORIENTATION=+